MLGHDNLEEFQDPANYDLEEVPRSLARIDYHVRLAGEIGGPVLELACGSGIVALPMAATGADVTGVDLAPPMLEQARRKAVAAGLQSRTRWLHGDARTVRIAGGARRFALVVLTGNAFQAFLTDADQHALLATVTHHLRPGGRFAFETRQPGGHDLGDVVDEEPWDSFVDTAGRRVTVTGTQRYDHERALMHWTTFRRWHDGAVERCHTTRIACRFTDVPQLDALLHAHGLAVERRCGDWDGSPLGPASEHVISVCR